MSRTRLGGRLRRAAGAAAVTIVAGGCFAYRAAEPARLAPGQVVRLTLTPSGAQDLTQQVGPRVEALDGRVLQARDSAFSVAVTQLSRTRAGEEFWTGDSVVVPFRGVSSLWVRRLDRKRSAMAVGGAIVAVFVMRHAVQEAGLFGGGPGRPPGSQ